MQTVSMNIFQLKSIGYLVTVNKHSKWPTCRELKNSPSTQVIELLKRKFLDFGRPETLVSGKASYFTSPEFKHFTKAYNVGHITVSPHFSRSNGLAEGMIQTVKTSLSKDLHR